jgi:hypothetical protein
MKKEKVNDQQLGKIIELLSQPYTSDNFWIGIEMIMRTSVSQKRFVMYAYQVNPFVEMIQRMINVVYYNNVIHLAGKPEGTLDLEWLTVEFSTKKWYTQAKPHLPWWIGNYSGVTTTWKEEWGRRRPPFWWVLNEKFEDRIGKWKEEKPLHFKVALFFTLHSIWNDLRVNTKVNAADLGQYAMLAKAESSLSWIRTLIREATGFKRYVEQRDHCLMMENDKRDSIAKLRYWKWEIEEEVKNARIREKEIIRPV